MNLYKCSKKFQFIVIGILLSILILFLPIIPTSFTVYEEISYQKEIYERPIIYVVTNHTLRAVYNPIGINSEVTIVNADHFGGEVRVNHTLFINETQVASKLDSFYISPGKTHVSSVLIPINISQIGIIFIGKFNTMSGNITDDSRVVVHSTIEKEKFEYHSIVRIVMDAISKLTENIFYEIWKFNPHLARVMLDSTYELISVHRVPSEQELTPPILARFFDGFDINRNGYLDTNESKLFFLWVEKNIIYRFDYEYATPQSDLLPNALIGDGRSGPEYWQTPYITWTERAGDCEDMAILQVAFHNYFNISAKVALVATKIPGEIDHAIAIVRISDNIEDFIKLLGKIKYFKIDGYYYMLVDNAYSNEFGTLSKDPIEGTFNIYETYSLKDAVLRHSIMRTMLRDGFNLKINYTIPQV